MKKKIIILALIFTLGFSAPLYASRGAGAIAYITKEFGLDLIARALARKLLTSLSDGIVDSINTLGKDKGNPAPSFVQNWKKFLADAQRIGENQFRTQINYTIQKGILCDDLQGPLALAFQASSAPYIDIGQPDLNDELKQDTLTPFQTKIKCTIPDKVREDFKKSFEKGGGWETWSRLVEPQNNLAGALAISMEELTRQRGSQENARQSEVVAGGGFTGVQDSCRGTGASAQCTFLGKTVTPAKLLGESAAQWFDNNSKWLVTSDELSEVIMAVVNAAVNKLGNFALDKTPFQSVKPGEKDKGASQAGSYIGGAQQDCINSCVATASGSCGNPLYTPEEKQACEDEKQATCERQCAVP